MLATPALALLLLLLYAHNALACTMRRLTLLVLVRLVPGCVLVGCSAPNAPRRRLSVSGG